METQYKPDRNVSFKGALFIEYALILAFVIGVGVAFLTGNGFSGDIDKIFTKTGDVTQQAAYNWTHRVTTSTCWLKDLQKGTLGYYDTTTVPSKSSGWIPKVSTSTSFENLGEAGTYKVSFDLDAMADNLVKMGVCANIDEAKQQATAYMNRTQIGIWAVEGSNITSDNKELTLDGSFKVYASDGNTQSYTGLNGQAPTAGDSSTINLSKNSYQLTTTKTTSVGYNIISTSQAQAEKDKDFAKALVNGGIVYSKQ